MSEQPAILRILDANLNRAREGLRVVEEYVRFVLEDAGLSEALKQLRHDLAASVPESVAGLRAVCRDSREDVGRTITTESETLRTGATEVALASAARMGEALRSIEEYGKTVDAKFAQTMEQLRYRGYEIERRLKVTLRARERFGSVRLYVLITAAHCRRNWLETARLAIDGGADALQLREKNIPDGELLDRAKKLVALCRERDTLCIINDRPDIAMLAHADGVHVGQDDLPVTGVRRILPPTMIVGVSTHTPRQIDAAVEDAPDYIAVGPMFATATKPQECIAGPEMLAYARQRTSLPLVAIGGITGDRAVEIRARGAHAICVCSSVVATDDPAGAARQLAGYMATEAPSPVTPR